MCSVHTLPYIAFHPGRGGVGDLGTGEEVGDLGTGEGWGIWVQEKVGVEERGGVSGYKRRWVGMLCQGKRLNPPFSPSSPLAQLPHTPPPASAYHFGCIGEIANANISRKFAPPCKKPSKFRIQ